MDTFTRICKKCLLREMSEADTYKTMYEYIANLNPDDKTPDQDVYKRQATASAIYMARNGFSKEEIKEYIEREFHYNLNRTQMCIRDRS